MSRTTKQIATAMGCAYIYDDYGRINLRADKVPVGKDIICEILPPTGTINTKLAPQAKVTKEVIFAFLRHIDLDFHGDDAGNAIDAMLELAKEFIIRLDASGEYEPQPDEVTWNAVLDFLDANMAGVRVTLELVPIVGDCVDFDNETTTSTFAQDYIRNPLNELIENAD